MYHNLNKYTVLYSSINNLNLRLPAVKQSTQHNINTLIIRPVHITKGRAFQLETYRYNPVPVRTGILLPFLNCKSIHSVRLVKRYLYGNEMTSTFSVPRRS